MRIAVWHNLPSGGGRRLLGDHLRHLLRAGHTVGMWTTPEGVADDLPRLPTVQDTRVVDLPLRWRRRTWSALPPWFVVRDRLDAMDRHLDAVAAEIDAWAPDVIFANSCRYLRAVRLGPRVQAPSVLYLGEPYRWLYEALPDYPWTSRRAVGVRRLSAGLDRSAWGRQARAEQAAIRGYDRVLVNSLYSRESALRAYGAETTLCYPGIDLSRYASRETDEPAYVLSLGALAPEKRPDMVVDAVAAMRQPVDRLVWVGNVADARYAALIRSRAAAAGVALDLRVGVPDDELATLLGGATAFAYAPRLEPFGMAPLEAAACGVPAVVVPEGGVRETVVDGVTGLYASTVDEMASALDRLVGDPSLRNRLGAAARDAAISCWDTRSAGVRLEQQLIEAAARVPAGRTS